MKPTKNEKLNGVYSVWSNSYGAPTGYGQQVKHLIDNLKKHKAEVAMLSNYGQEASVGEINTPYGKVKHFPRGFDQYSNDVAPLDHKVFANQFPDKKNALITLYDVWVMTSKQYEDLDQIASWTPLDHITLPPNVKQWLVKPNVRPIAMAPNGVRMLEQEGIECDYAPHAIDTKIYKPTFSIANGMTSEDYLGSKDKFVVGMVAANKASGLIHRKAFSENLMAYSIFKQKHPDAMLYIHTEPFGFANGWNLIQLISAVGLTPNDVMFPDLMDYRFGLPQEHMAAIYTGMDVLLAPSYGEGFGVPTMEAQACGTPVIGSSWAATPDLVSDDCWLVEGQPMWDASQNSWWKIPSVPSIVKALEAAYAKGKGRSQASIDFAADFDIDAVWNKHWLPILRKLEQ
jgi:hypothetical protein